MTRVKPKDAAKANLPIPGEMISDERVSDLFDLQPAIPFPDGFDEAAYLAANPDVTAAVTNGEYRSGYYHYLTIGWREKRPLFETGSEPRGRSVRTLPKLAMPLASSIHVHLTVEAVLVSDAGGLRQWDGWTIRMCRWNTYGWPRPGGTTPSICHPSFGSDGPMSRPPSGRRARMASAFLRLPF